MKVLLINPPFARSEVLTKKIGELGVSSLLPPLGLAYVAAVLEKRGHEVAVIDGVLQATSHGYGFEELKEDIVKSDAGVVGITATTPQIKAALATAALVKATDPAKITVLGGPHITSVPETLLETTAVDYGVWGEGEFTMLEVVEKLSRKEGLAGLAGVIWKEGYRVRYQPRPYIEQLDELPLPARHLLSLREYRPSIAGFRKLPATQIMTSRGCPHHCIFCHKATSGFNFRAHSPDYVLNEIEHLVHSYGIRDIQVFDDAFTLDPERVKKICRGILARKFNLVWNCLSRVDSITPELLRLMKAAGCYQIGIGVESGSPRILRLLRKGVSKEQIKKAVRLIHSFGMEIRAFFMLGIPTETRTEAQMTIDFAKELNPAVAQFLITTPYPGTEMWKLCQENGTIRAEDFSTFTMFRFDQLPYISNTIPPAELAQLYRRAIITYYLRPRYLFGQLTRLSSFNDIKRYSLALRGLSRL